MAAHAAVLLSLLASLAVRAQDAPTCPSSVSWLNNAKNQDPCHVASFLLGQCTDTTYNLTVLGSTYSGYAGPESTNPADYTYNGCLCCMPIYNLFMSCQSACQGKNTLTYEVFTGSCNSTFTGSNSTPTLFWPQLVPDTTVIPPWAQIDNTGQPWTEQEAQANISGSTGTSISLSSSTSGAATVGPTAAPTGGGSSGGGGGHSNAGAIAGGLVGGIAVVAIIGGAGAYVLRRSRRRDAAASFAGRPESGVHPEMQQGQHLPMAPYPHPAVSPADTSRTHSSGGGPHGSWPGAPQWGQRSSESGAHGANPFAGSGSTPSAGHDGSYQHHPWQGGGGTPSPRADGSYPMVPELMSPEPRDISQPDRYDAYERRM